MRILAGMVLLPFLVAGITAQEQPQGQSRPKRTPTKGKLLGLLGGFGKGGGGCGSCGYGGGGGGVSWGGVASYPTYTYQQPSTIHVVERPVAVPVPVPVQKTVVKEVLYPVVREKPVYHHTVEKVPVYVERQPEYHYQKQPSYQQPQNHEPTCYHCGGNGGGGSHTYSRSSSSSFSSSEGWSNGRRK